MAEGTIFNDIYEKRLDTVKQKISEDASLACKKDSTGRSPFHWACSSGQLELAEFLWPHVQDVNDTDDLGWTALMMASSAGFLRVVDYLIGHGASTTMVNRNGQTALHYAASKNHAGIVSVLLERGAYAGSGDKMGATPLHRAASQGHGTIVRLLLADRNCVINATDAEGNTALHMACEEDRRDVACMLVKAGAALDLKNKAEATPLDLADPGLRKLINETLKH